MLYYNILIAFFSGLLPVLFWLWFFEHEDKHPEPIKLTIIAFLSGMAMVIVALPLENYVCGFLTSSAIKTGSAFCITNPPPPGIVIFAWVAIEELLKFGITYILVLRRAENHEPIDSMMYLITAALGFSALENALFVFSSIYSEGLVRALGNSDLRFIGASLLHVVASSVIGYALAISFYKSKRMRIIYGTAGLVVAIVLHALFNFSIMRFNNTEPIIPFYGVWIAVILLLLAFEKVKQVKKAKKS